MTRALPVATLVIGMALAGCGGDGSGETTTAPFSIPAITSPIPATTTTAPATTTTPTETTTTTPGKPNRFNPKQPDSATNDVPPPPDSPQETFEKQCEQNQACG